MVSVLLPSLIGIVVLSRGVWALSIVDPVLSCLDEGWLRAWVWLSVAVFRLSSVAVADTEEYFCTLVISCQLLWAIDYALTPCLETNVVYPFQWLDRGVLRLLVLVAPSVAGGSLVFLTGYVGWRPRRGPVEGFAVVLSCCLSSRRLFEFFFVRYLVCLATSISGSLFVGGY